MESEGQNFKPRRERFRRHTKEERKEEKKRWKAKKRKVNEETRARNVAKDQVQSIAPTRGKMHMDLVTRKYGLDGLLRH